MDTNHNKTWQKNNSLRDPDTCRRWALGWHPSSPCTPSHSSASSLRHHTKVHSHQSPQSPLLEIFRTSVEDAPLVGTLLLHHVLPHSLLPTLVVRNEREVQPQSLRDPMRGWGPRSSRHLWLSILIFINFWTIKLNELYTKKPFISQFPKPCMKWGNERCILVLMS